MAGARVVKFGTGPLIFPSGVLLTPEVIREVDLSRHKGIYCYPADMSSEQFLEWQKLLLEHERFVLENGK